MSMLFGVRPGLLIFDIFVEERKGTDLSNFCSLPWLFNSLSPTSSYVPVFHSRGSTFDQSSGTDNESTLDKGRMNACLYIFEFSASRVGIIDPWERLLLASACPHLRKSKCITQLFINCTPSLKAALIIQSCALSARCLESVPLLEIFQEPETRNLSLILWPWKEVWQWKEDMSIMLGSRKPSLLCRLLKAGRRTCLPEKPLLDFEILARVFFFVIAWYFLVDWLIDWLIEKSTSQISPARSPGPELSSLSSPTSRCTRTPNNGCFGPDVAFICT